MPTLVWCALLTMSGLHFPADAAAQATDPDPVRVTLHGVVFDALSGTPVAGAAVYLREGNYGVVSDLHGTFRIDEVATGSQTVAAIQFGYQELAAVFDVPGDGAFIEIELTPQPILLDGVTAVVDNISTMRKRLDARRRSVPYQGRVFDQARLLRSPSSNLLDFLSRATHHSPVSCPDGVELTRTGNSSQSLGWSRLSQVAGRTVMWAAQEGTAAARRCIVRRGRFVKPSVYIDEMPVIGGLDVLESYPTAQIYSLEVYSQGAEIRAYTYGFMRRMAEEPVALVPLDLWP